MPLLVTIVFIIGVLALIIFVTQSGTIRQLRKSQAELLKSAVALKIRNDNNLTLLEGYTKQDPITALSLLKDHVVKLKKQHH